MDSQVIPIFVRVIGFAGKGKHGTFGELSDPSTLPVLIVCFGYNGFVESGFYFPELCQLRLMFPDDEDDGKDVFINIPREDGRYQACLDTISHFANCLLTGGTSMDQAKTPPKLISRRSKSLSRIQH